MVLADDHAFYRQGLASILSADDIEVVGQAADGREALDVIESSTPGVAIFDVSMPRMSGIEATRRLSERPGRTRVLIVSVAADEDTVIEAIVAGASGYILKDDPTEEVLAGVRAVGRGLSFASPTIARVLLKRIQFDTRARVTPTSVGSKDLSARELEILRLLAEGYGNHDIAKTLFISPRTARNHVSTLLRKMELDNGVQAAVQAVREGLV